MRSDSLFLRSLTAFQPIKSFTSRKHIKDNPLLRIDGLKKNPITRARIIHRIATIKHVTRELTKKISTFRNNLVTCFMSHRYPSMHQITKI